MKKRGFSLLECIIVLSLILFASGLLYNGWRLFDGWIVRTETEKLFSVCRYLQQRAMATGQEQQLLFDVINNAYRYNDTTVHLTDPALFGVRAGIKGPPSNPLKEIAQPITFTDNSITFYPDGVIKSGTVYLSNKSKQSSYALSVPISAISYIRMYRYDGSWKQL